MTQLSTRRCNVRRRERYQENKMMSVADLLEKKMVISREPIRKDARQLSLKKEDVERREKYHASRILGKVVISKERGDKINARLRRRWIEKRQTDPSSAEKYRIERREMYKRRRGGFVRPYIRQQTMDDSDECSSVYSETSSVCSSEVSDT